MKFFLLLFFLPVNLFAQPATTATTSITGLWAGYIITDEIKVPYELVITETGGKISGFSYTTFIVNGREVVTMKKVLVRQAVDIIIEDDDNLYNNFPTDLPKKIRQVNTLALQQNVLPLQLTGTFETKVPRSYKRAVGRVFLEKKESPADSKLIAKLDDMKIMNTVAIFEKPSFKEPPAPSIAVAEIIPEENTILARNPQSMNMADPLAFEKPTGTLKMKQNEVKYTPVASKPIPEVAIGDDKKTAVVIPVAKTTASNIPAAQPKTMIAKQPLVTKPAAKNKTLPVAVIKGAAPTVAKAAVPKPLPVNIAVAPAIDLGKRKIETIDQLYIISDSLQFTLYDNGFVDGDTVSIILNGKTIVSRQGLSTLAFTKTIYLTPDMGDSVQLVMYAESLGTIPPNTGLLILNYDNQRREVRFSGDLLKNAAITLRRKEK